jgi:secreted trypsin-like serine protease
MSKFTALILSLAISSYSCENVEISPTIVGGRNATLGQFPYMVSLQGKATPGR